MNRFVVALGKEGNCFQYFSSSFSGLTKKNLKAGIFDFSQIRKIILVVIVINKVISFTRISR